jgi:hypothetical protein
LLGVFLLTTARLLGFQMVCADHTMVWMSWAECKTAWRQIQYQALSAGNEHTPIIEAGSGHAVLQLDQNGEFVA